VALDTTATPTTQDSVLTVPASQKAGMSVAVAKATVSKPTWVVVYDSVGGKPGNALGAQLVFKSGAVNIALLRSTVAGKTYFVGERVDNGDHKYSKTNDASVGHMVTFTAN